VLDFGGLLLLVGFILISALACLFTLFRESTPAAPRRWAAWEFDAASLGRPGLWRLALVSFLGLFIEMLMIRWISSEIRIFAYFKNFVLIACFLGFGLGCYLCRRRINFLTFFVPLLLLVLLVQAPWPPLRELIAALPRMLADTSEMQVWEVTYVGLNYESLRMLFLSSVLLILPVFALIALLFVPIGQLVGWYLEQARGIRGYTVNILGSLAGMAVYTGMCLLSAPPSAWVILAGAATLGLLWARSRLRWPVAALFAFCVLMLSLPPFKPGRVYWSPYQKLRVVPLLDRGETVGYSLMTNESWYQWVANLSPEFVAAHLPPTGPDSITWNSYNIPYHFYVAPPSVLVLGSGMGNDVAAALRNGAGRVVAVEIDPLILRLGRELHFEHPYDSPRVTPVLDDARSYIQNGQDKFDLIVFSLLDSHTTSSHYSNIRIDNYVYTQEALSAARRLLRDDGIFIVKFQVNTPWIADRLDSLLKQTFGQTPLQVQVGPHGYNSGGRFFITGSRSRMDAALRDPALADYVRWHRGATPQTATLTTDDWPYFYQRNRGLPLSVLVISVLIVIVGGWLLRSTAIGAGSIRWHFFFLGAAFLLLEAQIISRAALLFGTTWLVNSIVIAGLMLLIVAANFVVEALPGLSLRYPYAGIALSAALAYFLPTRALFVESVWLRALLCTVVLCVPVFFAGIIFVRSFAEAGFSGECLGSNLLGALVGGLLESLSMWIGIKALVLVAAALYGASALALLKRVSLRTAALAPSTTGDD
jgi:SAM-dependent methyltransferase